MDSYCPFRNGECIEACQFRWAKDDCLLVLAAYHVNEILEPTLDGGEVGQPSIAPPIPVVCVPTSWREAGCSRCGKRFNYDESGCYTSGRVYTKLFCSNECQDAERTAVVEKSASEPDPKVDA